MFIFPELEGQSVQNIYKRMCCAFVQKFNPTLAGEVNKEKPVFDALRFTLSA